MTRRLSLSVLLAVLAGCSISSSQTEGPIGACAPAVDILGARAVCARNADCCSYNCQNGYCRETTVLGGICRTSLDCGPNMTCKSGACAAGLLCHDNGDVCSGANGPNTQCCGGHCSGFTIGVTYGECTPNAPPAVVINGGIPIPDASRNVLLTVTGSVSDPDGGLPPSCTWTVTAPGRATPEARFTQTGTCNGATTFPFTPDLEGPWTVALSGDDGFNLDPANPRPVVRTTTINVVNDAPVATMVPIAGNELSTVYANLDANGSATITVDGSSSSDRNGDTWIYLWSVLSSPPSSFPTLSGADTARPSFTADAVGDYVLSLVVTDPAWDSTRDPFYRGADRAGANSAALTVTVRVHRYVKRLADSHDLVDADYAKTPNKIVLLGHQPTDPSRSNGMLWVYDVATGQEGTGIPIQEPAGGWSNSPTSVGVTTDGLRAVAGDSTFAWSIAPLDATAVVTKLDPAAGCLSCGLVRPIGDVAVVGTRHVFLFNSSTNQHFVDLDLNNNTFSDGGYYGRRGAAYVGATSSNLFVANAALNRLDRYTVTGGGAGPDYSYPSFGCATGKLWAAEIVGNVYVFDSCGGVFSSGTAVAPSGTTLTPSPDHVDSRDGRTVTLGQNGQQVNRYTSTFGTDGADPLPVWADAGGGKHQGFGMFAFLAPDGSRIVFLRTSEAVSRYGVIRFGP